MSAVEDKNPEEISSSEDDDHGIPPELLSGILTPDDYQSVEDIEEATEEE